MGKEAPAPLTILTQAKVGLAVLEPPGTLRWANDAFFEASRWPREWLGRDVHDIANEGDPLAVVVRDRVAAALREGHPVSQRSARVPGAGSARDRYFEVDVRELVEIGEPRRELVELHDVTDRVEEHHQARLFYSSFLTSSNAIEITDANGVLVDVNPAFERIYGYTRAECIGRRPNMVRSRQTPSSVYDRMWADLLDPARGFWSGELLNRDRQGNDRPVFLTITGIKNDAGVVTHYLGVAVDLSERKYWERVAGHADRLASLGQLAAGVAHEINTPLANVMLVTESLRRRNPDPWTRGRLDTITGQVEVAAKIVRGLLDFARRSEPQMAGLDLRDVAHDAVEFLKGKQSENVEFEVRLPEQRVPIWGDRSQLIQVLTNVLNNAYDAMEGEGRIWIEVRRTDDDAEVQITDSGPGISEEALPHIFEPFYTTKPEGQGTGLGLAICHGIIQTHHGSMVARNLPPRGASFLITLPIAAPPDRAPPG